LIESIHHSWHIGLESLNVARYRHTLVALILSCCAVGVATGDDSTLQSLAHLRGESVATPLAGTAETAYVQTKSVADVNARLARLQIVRPDVAHNDATDQELLQYWGVMGPPTLILVGPDGNERRDLRVEGEINAREFLERLDTTGTP